MASSDNAAEPPRRDNQSNPFIVLGLLPTLEAARIKRVYFAAVALHPPHESPEAFRRVREAYEKLQRPGDRALAYLSAEIGPEEQAEYVSPYDQRVAELRSADASTRASREKIDRFVALAETSTLARMIEVCRSKA